MKICSKCKIEKSLDAFYKPGAGKPIYSYCKECARKIDQRRRDKKRQHKLDTSKYLPI